MFTLDAVASLKSLFTLWTSIVIIVTLLLRFGAHSAGEIPVLIPNTEVKPSCADYTALRETRKVPNYGKPGRKTGFFLVWRLFVDSDTHGFELGAGDEVVEFGWNVVYFGRECGEIRFMI